jgi:hypothetical protein
MCFESRKSEINKYRHERNECSDEECYDRPTYLFDYPNEGEDEIHDLPNGYLIIPRLSFIATSLSQIKLVLIADPL